MSECRFLSFPFLSFGPSDTSVAPILEPSGSKETPCYKAVPKGFEENLEYRRNLLETAADSREAQRNIWLACSRDLLFYINAFVWTYDPRKIADGQSPKLPFITWPYQDDAFLALSESIGKTDVLIEKSRDMGASWICLTLFEWCWHFRDLQSFLMVSRKEGLVDGTGDSLFSHVDFIHKNIPTWLMPEIRRNKLKLLNLTNGSKIEGESTTDNIGRGGRRTAMLIDEFAAFENGGYDVLSATADTTNSRIFNSTPAGTANAFYAQRQAGTPRMRFHWSQHPEKAAGLWYDDEGNPQSEWYQREKKRRAHEVEIATQLDIDYQGSAYPFFDPKTLEQLKKNFVRRPTHVGSLYVEEGFQPKFVEDDVGLLKVWCDLDRDMNPPRDREYVVGCDISQGTGASDSAIAVVDRLSGEKVAEFCSNRISANRFAELTVALCRMFKGVEGRGAFLIWEATGPGRTFGRTVIDECEYANIYFKTDETSLRRKQSDRPGWFSTGEGKKDLLMNYRDSLVTGKFINPSEKALIQAGEFVYLPSGRVEHGGASQTIDPSDSRDNHGDVVIADALCAKILRERETKDKQRDQDHVPVMSLEWRRRERVQELAESIKWE